MAELKPVFQNIANAIREKNGLTDTYTPEQMPAAIQAIPSGGGGGGEPPAEALVLSGSCNSWYEKPLNKWLFDNYKNKITTKDLSDCSYMFRGCPETEFPFAFNVVKGWNVYLQQICSGMKNLKKLPVFTFKDSEGEVYACNFMYMFEYCEALTDENVPIDWIEKNIYNNFKETQWYSSGGSIDITGSFRGCYQITRLPKMTMLYNLNVKIGVNDQNELPNVKSIDLPVASNKGYYGSRIYGFSDTPRLAHLTFDKNREYYKEGTVMEWDGLTIDISHILGYTSRRMPGARSEETRIWNEETYQKLKDNPQAWTDQIGYACYNHDSAVETINSLPQTSGNNTIQFNKWNGDDTAGGAINTLTPEEIAVATAKGFTVTFQ